MLDVNVWTNNLIGRDRELAALGSLLEEAVGDGATLLLTGEPGVGKTPNRTLSELDDQIGQLRNTEDDALIIRTAIAGFYADRLPGCQEALLRVVRDGRGGGAVGTAIMALHMLAIGELNAGRWDEARRLAAEGTALCEQRSHRLYAWAGRYAIALVAGNRGDRAACQDICQAMIGWATPRQLGRLADFAHHVSSKGS